jgi:uncharacterized membrane protein YphA (DoxX/SURF4 family)
MNSKTKNILYWTLTGLVALIFVGSSSGKLMGSAETVQMAESFGISGSLFTTIGIIELMSVILFVIPRTGVLGTLLLTGYMGGAVATHLQHNISVVAPSVILAFVWIVAVFRFPELLQRIKGNNL